MKQGLAVREAAPRCLGILAPLLILCMNESLCDAWQPPSPSLSIRHALRGPSTRCRPLSMALPEFSLPFEQMGQQLADMLDVGGALNQVGNIPEAATSMVLESIGRDLLVFLSASVLVTPLCTAVGITPILGYLLAGALLGPHGMDMFSNTKADVELGDFGILFLLFSEGLEVSSSRLQKLTNYLPLGLAQISLTAASLSAAILLLPQKIEKFLPLDAGLINIRNPAEALILALAGTLSTSAFVFPVLKEREWEEEDSGQAATSILLLQDLAVAPLLVLLPFIVGKNVDPNDYSAIGFLTAKATIGFGSVIVAGSFVLRRLFQLVAQSRSTETFVALCLLVSAGMGAIAKMLGLTDTAGAFAAGVLLANTNYRAQIQADILPFKGILLGIFFMDAGSRFDTDLVLAEWPTILTGVVSLILLKAVTLFSATRVPRWMEPNRLPVVDGVRLALLLAGGGEFAFVVLALAQKLGVLPKDLGGLLTAIVLITMAVTPVLGELAAVVSEPFASTSESISVEDEAPTTQIASDATVICGYGGVGRSLLKVLGDEFPKTDDEKCMSPRIVAFDSDPSLGEKERMPMQGTAVLFGDASNPQVLRSSSITNPSAIFISYEEDGLVLSATFRLRAAFRDAPIYARAQTRDQAQSLKAAGATEVIVESDELSRSAVSLMQRTSKPPKPQERRLAAAEAAGVSPIEADELLELYECLDEDGSGLLEPGELASMLRKSNTGIISDDEIEEMEEWLRKVVTSPIDSIQFCRMYAYAPENVKKTLSDACLLQFRRSR